MPICYLPKSSVQVLSKIFNPEVEILPLWIQDYYFKLEEDWLTKGGYNQLSHITLNDTHEDKQNHFQELVTLTYEQPSILMTAFFLFLTNQYHQNWPFQIKSTHTTHIHVTQIQFSPQTSLNFQFHCVVHNQHRSLLLSLKEWHFHLIKTLEYQRLPGLVESAELIAYSFPIENNLITTTFKIDDLNLTVEQWYYLLSRRYLSEEKVIYFDEAIPNLTNCSSINSYRQKRNIILNELLQISFNAPLKKEWEAYEQTHLDFLTQINQLKRDKKELTLSNLFNLIECISDLLNCYHEKTESLSINNNNLIQRLDDSIDNFTLPYLIQQKKYNYFLSIRNENNQQQREAHYQEAFTAVGISESFDQTIILNKKNFFPETKTYSCQQEIENLTTNQESYKQITSLLTKLEKKINNITEKLNKLKILFKTQNALLEEWKKRKRCDNAYQRCFAVSYFDATSDQLENILITFESDKKLIEKYNQISAKYTDLKDKWQDVWENFNIQYTTLNNKIYSTEKNELTIPVGLATLVENYNEFLTAPEKWEKEKVYFTQWINKFNLIDDNLEKFSNNSVVMQEFNFIQLKLKEIISLITPPSITQINKLFTFFYFSREKTSVSKNKKIASSLNNICNTLHNYYFSKNTLTFLELYFENKLAILIKTKPELLSFSSFCELIVINDITLFNYQKLNKLPHHYYTSAMKLVTLEKEFNQLEKFAPEIAQLKDFFNLYPNNSLHFYKIKPYLKSTLPYPFNEKNIYFNINDYQQNCLAFIGSCINAQEIREYCYLNEFGRETFPLTNDQAKYNSKNSYPYIHECFKAPHVMLALYHIELKILEANSFNQEEKQDLNYKTFLAEAFKLTLFDFLHCAYWQDNLFDATEKLIIKNPNDFNDTKEYTAVTFIQESINLFPNAKPLVDELVTIRNLSFKH